MLVYRNVVPICGTSRSVFHCALYLTHIEEHCPANRDNHQGEALYLRSPIAEVPLQTVERALRLLLLFTQKRPEWSLRELSEELGLARSMVHRMLQTLEALGFLIYHADIRRYRLGLSLLTLGQVVYETFDIRQIARPFLEELANQTDTLAFLSVEDGGVAVTLDQVNSQNTRVRLTFTLGNRAPLHASAGSLVILAHMPEEFTQQYVAKPLTRFTANTVTDPVLLLERLQEIRERGYAISRGEVTPGLTAIAAPIFGPGHQLVGTIGVSVVDQMLTPDDLPGLVEKVRVMARQVTLRLGTR